MTRFEERELLRQNCRNLAVLLETVIVVCRANLEPEFYQKATDAIKTAKVLA